mgnify:CR=1 FL=1
MGDYFLDIQYYINRSFIHSLTDLYIFKVDEAGAECAQGAQEGGQLRQVPQQWGQPEAWPENQLFVGIAFDFI